MTKPKESKQKHRAPDDELRQMIDKYKKAQEVAGQLWPIIAKLQHERPDLFV